MGPLDTWYLGALVCDGDGGQRGTPDAFIGERLTSSCTWWVCVELERAGVRRLATWLSFNVRERPLVDGRGSGG